MRVLIAPMASIAETSGPFGRAKALALDLQSKGHEVALCAAEEINYQPLKGIKNYAAPIPSPMGLPEFVGKRMFKVAQKLGVQQRRVVKSFEEVLHIVGAIDSKFFPKDVAFLLEVIRGYKPDVVYAEFRPAAIVAAKLAGIKVVTGYSYPVQKAYASSPQYSGGVKEFLKVNKLPPIESVLDIFNWAEIKFVPSSYALEPIEGSNVEFTGPFGNYSDIQPANGGEKSNIVVYMGNGSVTSKTQISVLSEAFSGTKYQVYIATLQSEPIEMGNIHVDRRFDFSKLLPDAAAFINHGGQNSIMTGLIYGVPQIVCPGNVFERKYNAASVASIGAGMVLENNCFDGKEIQKIIDRFICEKSYSDNAIKYGKELIQLGGTSKVIEELKVLCREQ